MKRRPKIIRARRGFSLIEMAIAMAVTAVILTSAVPSFMRLVDTRRLDGVASQLAGDLQFARTEAILRNQALRFELQTGMSGAACYVIHTGSKDQCRCDATGAAQCEGEAQAAKVVSISTPRIGLHANVSSVRFDPLHGTVTPTATLIVANADGREVRHVIGLMGRVRSCSPQASVSGYRAC